MQSIGSFALTNEAAEVVKLQFVYWDADGKRHHKDGSGDITVGVTNKRSPGDSGVPAGAKVSLYCFVVWGNDVEADEQFIYDPTSQATAVYVVKGTTLDSHLTLLSGQTVTTS